MIYFTGGGQTIPQDVTGSGSRPMRKWLAQNRVTVGGLPAVVPFAVGQLPVRLCIDQHVPASGQGVVFRYDANQEWNCSRLLSPELNDEPGKLRYGRSTPVACGTYVPTNPERGRLRPSVCRFLAWAPGESRACISISTLKPPPRLLPDIDSLG